MTYSCLHTHTTFCDGKADVQTMCQAAYTKGFESIGFSSHAPIAKKTGIKTDWHLKDERLEEYIDTVLEARRRWEGKLKVYLGLEVDFIKGLCGPADKDIQSLPLDYIIGAVHYLFSPKNGELFIADAPPEDFGPGLRDLFDNDGNALYNAYFDMYGGLISAGAYDILAHLDLIKKNNAQFRFFSPEDTAYTKRLTETADLIAAASPAGADRRLIVEVNTGGIIRGRTADPYPSLAMLKLLRERNIPLTINADAHAPDHLGGVYETAREAMVQAGYGTMLLFEGRQKGKAVWREEKLVM
jgi:histidinol-phosphatase (PHP family)